MKNNRSTDNREGVIDSAPLEDGFAINGNDDRLIRFPVVTKMVPLGKTAIYDRIKKGTFPAPYKLGPNSVAWKKSEILRWINGLKRVR